nr:hypothetical protein [uncultured Mediterranean phage uvMED]
MNYYDDTHKLGILSKRIDRLEKSLERIETLGLSSSSSAGISKTFLDPYKIKLELDRCLAEYDFISNRLNNGSLINKQIKKVIFKNGSDI